MPPRPAHKTTETPAAPLITPTTLALDRQTLARLRPAAAARDTTIPRLCERLLDVIATDGLTDAVLDDDH